MPNLHGVRIPFRCRKPQQRRTSSQKCTIRYGAVKDVSPKGRLERNIILALSALFGLGAFGLATVSPAFLMGLGGWIIAAIQALRLYALQNDADQQPKGQVTDIILTILITILLSSAINAVVIYYRTVGEIQPWSSTAMDFETIQMMIFAGLVHIGGWAVGWVQGVRRLRLNLALSSGRA